MGGSATALEGATVSAQGGIAIGGANTAGLVAAVVSATNGIAIGSGNATTRGALVSAADGMAFGTGASASAVDASALGRSIANTVTGTTAIGNAGLESFRLFASTVGNHSERKGPAVITIIPGNTPTPTLAQIQQGVLKLSGATPVLQIGNLGVVDGPALDTGLQLAGNLYDGLSFEVTLVPTTIGATIAVSGTSSTFANGITPYGALSAGAANEIRLLRFVRTTVGEWDMHVK